jgi:hypothetical protein
LWDFELSVVYIDEKQNSDFDPIDLFIRLNNKPYPVKDHTFEMWNSYSDRTIVEEIKSIVKQSHKWFAYRVDNKRMANEELFTIFAYLGYEFEENNIDIFDHVDIYQSLPQTLTFRIQKSLVTEWLHEGYGQENLIFHQKIMSSIEHSKSFIEKVQVVSSSIQYHGDFKDKSGNELLKVQLDKLMNLDKAIYRGQKQFYVLWFLLLKLDLTLINNNAAELAKGIIEFFKGSMTMPDDFKETGLKPKEFFASKVEAFWDRYSN